MDPGTTSQFQSGTKIIVIACWIDYLARTIISVNQKENRY